MKKIRLLLYCTRSNKKLFYDVVSQKYMYGLNGKNDKFNSLNGKIVAECDFEVEEIRGEIITGICGWVSPSKYDWCFDKDLLDKSRLTNDQVCDYLDGNTGYAIHIKNLNIFDKPKELSDYWKNGERVKNAPQNMMLVQNIYEDKVVISQKEVKGIKVEKKVLISVRPEWICKILSKEKTIEVRKKVLKEMMPNE